MDRHPVLRCLDDLEDSLDGVADVAVQFLSTAEKREALLRSGTVLAQLESVRLRLMAASGDVADDDGCRDVATWLAQHAQGDRATLARAERLAHALDTRWPGVGRQLADGALQVEQAEVIVRSLEALPSSVPRAVLARAEAELLRQAAEFGPRELRVLGRRILDVVAPEIGDDVERRLLEAEEQEALRTTSLVTQRLGQGSTLVRIRLPDASADRRLACTARIIPAVLGGKSEVLDLGRGARLFSAAQRKAMRVRDRACRAQGCSIPATWCEAHHFGRPWSQGGQTELADGKLLCHWHHRRAHDERYLHTELPNGDVRFHRRR